jgi:hypothetical protein
MKKEIIVLLFLLAFGTLTVAQTKGDKIINNVWISADAYNVFSSKNPEKFTDIGFGLEVAYKTDKQIFSASYSVHNGLDLSMRADGYNRFKLITMTYGTPLFEKNNFFFSGRLGPSYQVGWYRVYQSGYPRTIVDNSFYTLGLFGVIDIDIKLSKKLFTGLSFYGNLSRKHRFSGAKLGLKYKL